jgi:hypothetical protein
MGNLNITALGGTSGLVHSTEGNTYQNSPNRNLRLLSFDGGPWVEGICIAAERAAVVAAQAVLDGSNTLEGHVEALGASLSPEILADVAALSQEIGVKITWENSIPLLATILANHGVIAPNVAKLMPTVIAAVTGYLKK